MEINDNPVLLWLVVGGILVVGWVVMPLGSFYRYVAEQHCLQTFGRRPQTALVMIETLEKNPQFRSGNRYHIVLSAEDHSFHFAYQGADDLINPSNYSIAALYDRLAALESQQPFEVRWVRSWLFAGEEQLITHIAGERVVASCAWGWIPAYLLLFAFFAVVTAMVISVTVIAQQMVEQNGDVASQENILTTAVDRWVEWLENKFGGGK